MNTGKEMGAAVSALCCATTETQPELEHGVVMNLLFADARTGNQALSMAMEDRAWLDSGQVGADKRPINRVTVAAAHRSVPETALARLKDARCKQ
ncbi:hypothetical protein N8I74_09915 [Chitiniphilus purpureus]|uniref:Uncharacterized protein n=1 Tax=Chitiniphilus purpureus TaxID=2981137 RepID=A0ABY6DH19_9NEIS|nr:hypothetical protein [Chitiniphilus sp. CD1]UXY13639.1 hypothetical protein N8I74_09915 [Chitiniphilus sp. CD1]